MEQQQQTWLLRRTIPTERPLDYYVHTCDECKTRYANGWKKEKAT